MSTTPRKRHSETEAGSFPKKRSKDVLSVISEPHQRMELVMVGETPRAPVTSKPSNGRNYGLSVVVDDTSSVADASDNKTIPKPPRMVLGVTPVPVHVETPSAQPPANRPRVTPESPAALSTQPTAAERATQPTAAVRASGPRPPTTKKPRTPWYYILVFVIAALLLVSNLLTLGLWVLTDLELDLKVRELTAVAGAEVDYASNPYDSLKEIFEGLASDKSSLAAKVDDVVPQLDLLLSERKNLTEDLRTFRKQAGELAKEINALSTSLESVIEQAKLVESEKKTLIKEIQQLREKSELYQKELGHLAEEHEEALRVQRHWESEAMRMEDERDRWHRLSLRTEHERDRAKATLEKRMQTVEQDLRTSRESLAALERERDGLQALVTDLMEQKRRLQQHCSA